MGELVHVRLPGKLVEDAKELVDEGYFSTLGDLIKDSLRRVILEYKKREALQLLAKSFGKGKGKIKALTEKERIKVAEAFIKEDTSKILREFGFE